MKCKKLVSMFLVVFMLVSIALIQTINVSADSSGTIYVSSYPDLVNMMKNPGGSYILLKDIEINNADNFSVQNFSGIFDGNGHSISFSNSREGGFVEVLEKGATIKNLHVYISAATGTDNVGIIAGTSYGTISNCWVSGYVSASGINCGGLVGKLSGGSVSDCYSLATVSGTSIYGGLIGAAENASVERCYVSASIEGSRAEAGSFLGSNSSSSINNCYYNSSKNGAFLGVGIGSDTVTAKTSEEMKSAETFAGFDFSNTWVHIDGEFPKLVCYNGKGTSDNPYKIHTNDELISIIQPYLGDAGTGRYYQLAANIKNYSGPSLGDDNSRFTGFFDGNGYVFYNTNISSGGIFYSVAENAVVKNVVFDGYNYSGGGVAGAVASINHGTIDNCNVGNGTISGSKDLGGIVGENINGTVTNCSFTGDINGRGSGIGGIVGYNSYGTISNCAVYSGTIRSSDHSVGGVVGDNSNGLAENCFSLASVNTSTSESGGVAGRLYNGVIRNSYSNAGVYGNNTNGTIENCYVYDTVVSAPSTVGGMAGRNDNNGKINNCYTGASVSEANYAGAFVGMNYAAISSSYANGGYSAGNAVPAVKFAGLNEGNITGENLDFSGNTLPYKYIQTSGLNISVNDTTVYTPQTPDVTSGGLTDISGHWAEQTIRNLVSKNVVNGYEDGTFRPEDSVTKGEFIKLLMSATGKGTSDGFTNYKDVNASWARPYVSKAIYLGICDNISDSTEIFGVDKSITRAQAVALMGRLLAPDKKGIPSFTDNSSIPDWASNEVYSMVELGLITGMEDGSFKPLDNITRAEAATIIERIMNLG